MIPDTLRLEAEIVGLLHQKLGSDLLAEGRVEEGMALCRHAALVHPTPGALNRLAAEGEIKPDDPRLPLAVASARTPLEAAVAYFAQARAWESEREWDRAWEAYERGNRILRALFPDKPVYIYQIVENVRRFHTRAAVQTLCARAGGYEERLTQPIFIVGSPRSGTSLTERVVAAHPAIKAGGEADWGVDAFTGLSALDSEPAAVRERVYAEFAKGAGPGRVTDKLPGDIVRVTSLWWAMPWSRFFLMQRDPLAVVASAWRTPFTQGLGWAADVEGAAHYQVAMHHLHAHILDVLGEAAMEVPYEWLVWGIAHGDDRLVRRMAEHAGVAFDPCMLRPEETKAACHTASMQNSRKPTFTSSISGWVKRYWRQLEPARRVLDRAGVPYHTP